MAQKIDFQASGPLYDWKVSLRLERNFLREKFIARASELYARRLPEPFGC